MSEVCLECWGMCIGITIAIGLIVWWYLMRKRKIESLNYWEDTLVESSLVNKEDILKAKYKRLKEDKWREPGERHALYVNYLRKKKEGMQKELRKIEKEIRDAAESFATSKNTYYFKRVFLGLMRVKKRGWAKDKDDETRDDFTKWIWIKY